MRNGLPESLWVYDGKPWWDVDAVADGEPTTMRRAVVETPDRANGDRFYVELLGSDPDVASDHTDHRWQGGSVRLVDVDVGRPRVGWIEVEGLEADLTIGGTRFRPAR